MVNTIVNIGASIDTGITKYQNFVNIGIPSIWKSIGNIIDEPLKIFSNDRLLQKSYLILISYIYIFRESLVNL